MSISMADSTDATRVPPGWAAYAGYVDGEFPSFAAIAEAHPSSHLLSLAVTAADPAHGLDVEQTDATVGQVAGWYGRSTAPTGRPCYYAAVSNVDGIVAQLSAAGLLRPRYRLLSAHTGAGEHICGPDTCRECSVPCDGTQWAQDVAGPNNAFYDQSLLLTSFFAAPPTPPPIQYIDKPLGGVFGKLNAPAECVAVMPTGKGYAIVGADGGTFNYGTAPMLGSLAGHVLAAPIIDAAFTPDGKGLYLVGTDGGVFAFGTAAFHGSMGGKPLVAPVTGIGVSPDGAGYWLVAADGGIFAFGDAPFLGSMA